MTKPSGDILLDENIAESVRFFIGFAFLLTQVNVKPTGGAGSVVYRGSRCDAWRWSRHSQPIQLVRICMKRM